ncbi:MAG: 6-pyruvoyl trahydropterin synthase family protein [Thermoplasmata archaeon]
MILEINGWDLNIKFSASHFIPYHGKCSRLHGHDYGLRVKIEGDLNDEHMIIDFIELKAILRALVEDMDHHVLIPKNSDIISVEEIEARVIVSFDDKEYIFPVEDVYYVDVEVTTAEELVNYLLKELIKKLNLPENVRKIELCLDEGIGQGVCTEMMLTR